MALNCEEKIDADIVKNCDENPTAGLEVDILIFNKSDLDYAAITEDGSNDLLITNFQLLSGKTGYLLEGIKQSNSAMEELVIKDFSNAYKHLIRGVLLNPTVANRKTLESLMSGGDYVAIVERKWKGDSDDDAFLLLGFDAGLTALTSIWDSKESDGVETFELASAEGYEEPKKVRSVLETNYATTSTAFGNKWIEP